MNKNINKKIISALICFFAFFILNISLVQATTIGTTGSSPKNVGLNSGLVAWWTLDGKDTPWTSATAGTVIDKSGNGRTGTLTNMNRSFSQAVGKIGQGLKFDGANDSMSTGVSLDFGSSKLASLSFWMYKESFNNIDGIVFETSSNFNSNDGAIVFGPNSSAPCLGYMTLAIQDSNTGSKYRLECYTRPSSNAWHHYVAIYDNTTTQGDVRLFIDGVEQSPFSLALNTKDKSSTLSGYIPYFMSRAGSSLYNEGVLDDFRIYNRILSASEIQQLYNTGAETKITTPVGKQGTGLNSGLVGWWTMDGKDTPWTSETAATTIDKSGNGRTGTLTNMNRSSSTALGKIGQGLNFNKISEQYVSVVDHTSLDNTATISFGGWFYIDQLPATNTYYGLVCKRVDGNVGNSYCSFINDSGRLNADIVGFNDRFTSNATLSTKRWNHYMVVFDGNLSSVQRSKIYINGQLDVTSSETSSSIPNGSSDLGLGFLPGNTVGYLDGKMDDVRVYNRALSASEIQHLYSTGSETKITTPVGKQGTGLNSGLVGWWTMDGKDTPWTSATVATAIDKSGNSNTGTLTNMSRSSSPTLGKLGQGLYFDGVNDYVERVDSASLDITGAITLSAWVKVSDLSSTFNSGIISKFRNQTGSLNQRAYNLFLEESTDRFGLTLSSDGTSATNKTVTATSIISTNVWYHVVATYSPSNYMRIYVNSVLEGNETSAIPASIANTSAPLWFGAQFDLTQPDYYFNGSIDDARIYNRVLSASEIQQLYNMGR